MQRFIFLVIATFSLFMNTAQVSGQPEIVVTPDSLYAELYTLTTTVESLTITNTGDSDLVFIIAIVPTSQMANLSSTVLQDKNKYSYLTEGSAEFPPTTESVPIMPVPTLNFNSITPSDFLVIDHRKDKSFFSSYTFDLASEVDLYTLTINDFKQYEVVYFEPDWFDYTNLSDNMSKISDYVKSGGVVVINVAGQIGDGFGIDPSETVYANFRGNLGGHESNIEQIFDPAHPYITGQPFGGKLLTTADFSHWNTTDLGSFLNYPDTAHSVLGFLEIVTWLEYRLGIGHVILTTLTYGWGGAGGRGRAFENLVDYAVHLSQTAWLDVDTTSGTIPPNSSLTVEVTFDATGWAGGNYSAIISINSNAPAKANLVVPATLNVLEYPCGDANGDLQVDQDDFSYLWQTYFYGGPWPISINSVDFNCNNTIDLSDVVVLGRFVNGIGSVDCCFDSL